MTILNVFRNDAFSSLELTSWIDRRPFQPIGIGELDLFEDKPIRTTALAVENRLGKLVVIPTSARGTAPVERTTEKRQMRYFDVPRLAHADTVYAAELQNVREFGTESVLMQMQSEMARRLDGPTGIARNLEYTFEMHRLGAIQGILYDADGVTELYNWFDEFGITPASEVVFNLAAKTLGSLRPICNQVIREMMRASQGAWTPSTRVTAVVGDVFWDALVTHPDVEKTYLNWADAQELRKGTAFGAMPFGGIDWINYRGSDDLTTIAVGADKAKFFPKGAPGVFQVAYAPGESAEWVNTPGKPRYVIPIFDRDRQFWWRQELYSYPLHICTRPEMLIPGTSASTAD